MNDYMNSRIRAGRRSRVTVRAEQSDANADMNRRIRREPDLNDPAIQEAMVDQFIEEREETRARSRGSADGGPRGVMSYQEPPPDMNVLMRWHANRRRRVQQEDRY